MDIYSVDKWLFFLINHGTANGVFDVLMPFMSSKGYTLLAPFMLYMLWLAGKHKGYGKRETLNLALWTMAISVFSFLLADWMANEIKHIFSRTRPCNALEGVRLLAGCTKSFSMPSGHSTNSFAYAVPLFFMTRGYMRMPWRLYPLLVAVMVAYSRVYLGVHYPGDIIAGAVLGTTLSAGIICAFTYARSKYRDRPHATLLFGFLFVLSVFRIFYVLHGPLDLSPDEAHYWEWSRRLDLSYYSKGPMIAYLIAFGTAIFGDTVFGVRFLAIVLSALSSILLFKLVCEMYKDKAAALGAALMFQAVPLFAAFGVIFSIDSPFLFFWVLSLLLFYRVISKNEPESVQSGQSGRSELFNWVVLGISMGLGLLTKYTMAFFHAGLFLFLITTDRRYLLKTIKPYAAAIVSLIVFSPVIIWNMQHDWVTVRHTAGQAHIAEGLTLSLRSFGEFPGSQIGIVTPVIFVLIFYALFRLFYSEKGYRSTYLLAFSIPVIAFFMLKSMQGKVQANWAMTGYITGIVAVAWYFLRSGAAVSTTTSRKRKTLVASGVVLAILVTAISHYPSLIKLPLKLDPSARLRGWHQLGEAVSPLYNTFKIQGPVFLFSDRYQTSSELAFYVSGHPKTYCINLGSRMNQYDLWPGMNEDAERIRRESGASAKTINAIFVTGGDIDMPPAVAGAFDGVEKKVVRVYDRGQELRVYSVFICYNFRGLKTGAIESY